MKAYPSGEVNMQTYMLLLDCKIIMIGGVENKWLYQGQNYNKW